MKSRKEAVYRQAITYNKYIHLLILKSHHIYTFYFKVFELVTSPKTGSTHTESVCARGAVNYILSTVLGQLLR